MTSDTTAAISGDPRSLRQVQTSGQDQTVLPQYHRNPDQQLQHEIVTKDKERVDDDRFSHKERIYCFNHPGPVEIPKTHLTKQVPNAPAAHRPHGQVDYRFRG